jgi:hypothetical protein
VEVGQGHARRADSPTQRIVKDHVEVETVDGQQSFNATDGRNDDPTGTAGKVLLQLTIKSLAARRIFRYLHPERVALQYAEGPTEQTAH